MKEEVQGKPYQEQSEGKNEEDKKQEEGRGAAWLVTTEAQVARLNIRLSDWR